jgi:hypothetical protein
MTQARRELTTAVQTRQDGHRGVDDAQRRLDEANRLRWRRRDQSAITVATDDLTAAESRHNGAVEAEVAIRGRLVQLVEHEQQRRHKRNETHQRRVELTGAIERLDVALNDTRTERVRADVNEPPEYLTRLLGLVPEEAVGREAWELLANKLEAQFDRGQSETAAQWAVCRDLGISPIRLELLSRFIAEQETRKHQAPISAPQPQPRWESPRYEIDRSRGRGREP